MVGRQAQSAGYEDDRMGGRLWNGISTVRVNCGTAIVGTPGQVAEKLLAYRALGIDELILSGYPHVEEARRVAEQVLPLVRAGAIANGRWSQTDRDHTRLRAGAYRNDGSPGDPF